MNSLLVKFNQLSNHPDLAKLLLRLGFGGMFLLHGINKIFVGTEFIQAKFIEFGMPGFFAQAVYLGEVVVPVLLIIGVLTRLSAFIGVGTCVFVTILMHSHNFFTLNQHGGWVVEGVAVYLVGFLAIMLLGSGKYALKAD